MDGITPPWGRWVGDLVSGDILRLEDHLVHPTPPNADPQGYMATSSFLYCAVWEGKTFQSYQQRLVFKKTY